MHEVLAGIEDRGDLLVNTLNSGEGELQLVESQSAYAHPMMQFEVTQLR